MIFDKRDSYKPFEYSHITDPLINAMWAGHWTHNEFSFKSDVQDYRTRLTPQEQQVIKRAILLISQVEVAVKTYWSTVGKLLPKPEIGDMGAVFGGIEVIHSRAYSEILSKLGFNDEFQALFAEGFVERRVKYLTKYTNKVYKNDHKNILYSLVLFTLFTENVSLFSQFYVILGFNKFLNVLKDTANVVQYTSKEENLHAEGGIALINQIRKEYPELFDEEFEQRILEESQEALEAECGLVDWILEGYQSEFLSSTILKNYVRYRINSSLERIGFKSNLELDPNLQHTIDWMEEEIYVPALTDFFVKKPIDYQRKMKNYDEIF